MFVSVQEGTLLVCFVPEGGREGERGRSWQDRGRKGMKAESKKGQRKRIKKSRKSDMD